jgi:hypothetical protein
MLAVEERPGLHIAIDLGDAVETGGHQFDRGDPALANFGRRLGQAKRA